MDRMLVERYGDALRQYAVEVKVDGTTGSYYLPDDSILRQSTILEVWINKNPNDNVTSPTGRAIVDDTLLPGIFLNLICGGSKQLWSHYPVVDLIPTDNNGIHRCIVAPDFTPSRSYITFNGVTPVSGESIMLNFTYIDEL